MIDKHIEKISSLTKEQLKHPEENINTIILHTNEELGEFCTAVCVEDGSSVKKYKTIDENSKSEAIDLIICAFSLYFARGGTVKEMDSLFSKKINKWDTKIKSVKVLDAENIALKQSLTEYLIDKCGYNEDDVEDIASAYFKEPHGQILRALKVIEDWDHDNCDYTFELLDNIQRWQNINNIT